MAIPFEEDRELAAHIAAMQPAPRPDRPARRSKPSKAADIHRGVIAYVLEGFAFVKPDTRHDGLGPDADLFAHRSHLQPGLKPGDRVSYTLHPSKRKAGQLEARDVRKVLQ